MAKKKRPKGYQPAIKAGHESEVPGSIKPLFVEMPRLRSGFITSSRLERPPILPAIFNLGQESEAFMARIWEYLYTISQQGKTFESFDIFERGLVFDFAYIVWLLRGFHREEHRMEFLQHFLRRLNLPNRRGAAKKSPGESMVTMHCLKMEVLRREELLPAWNTMKSLPQREAAIERLRKNKVHDDVIEAVMRPRATLNSSLVRLYSKRHNVPAGTARNALHKSQKLKNAKLPAPV